MEPEWRDVARAQSDCYTLSITPMHFMMQEGPAMKAMTLRNLPAELEKAIRKQALGKRLSVNKTVIGLLEEHLTPGELKRSERHHELDHLCGSWTEADAEAFDRALDKQWKIDQAIATRPQNC
jgi:hypothetical protein